MGFYTYQNHALVGLSFRDRSQGERLTRGLQIFVLLRRPYTEEDNTLYVFPWVMSIPIRKMRALRPVGSFRRFGNSRNVEATVFLFLPFYFLLFPPDPPDPPQAECIVAGADPLRHSSLADGGASRLAPVLIVRVAVRFVGLPCRSRSRGFTLPGSGFYFLRFWRQFLRRRHDGRRRDGRRLGGRFRDSRGGRDRLRRGSHRRRRRRVGDAFGKEIPDRRDDEYERQDSNFQTGEASPRF